MSYNASFFNFVNEKNLKLYVIFTIISTFGLFLYETRLHSADILFMTLIATTLNSITIKKQKKDYILLAILQFIILSILFSADIIFGIIRIY
ncbi:MAG: hypothetical protein ACD_18C00261G0002 [uncultured bacterium]|nr:MAG: hypothetical protein ACD_18C00261G0002 [uncultured bacterium]OGH83534.1 MAG: hypothetical protein A2488_01030 [Candidatus Magasanikbacteria bacterium RIFOXYC12_FULL_32_21b]OGH89148.1 MAG: hypothetical protein A2507_00670 [Candidatus Magasanikbacteria bacterium RIFOXYD12_FULL_33_17]HAO52873.1 hypothetical protein [Candidatus Magasanikbacteria bacterium]